MMELKGFYIIAIRDAVMNPTMLFADQLFDISNIDPQGWYPGEIEIQLENIIEKKLGKLTLIRIGRSIIKRNRDFILTAGYSAPEEYFREIDYRYRLNNRGPGIGKVELVQEEMGYILLKNSTPYNCILAEGIYQEVVSMHGGSLVTVRQKTCKRDGHSHCLFEIKWK